MKSGAQVVNAHVTLRVVVPSPTAYPFQVLVVRGGRLGLRSEAQACHDRSLGKFFN